HGPLKKNQTASQNGRDEPRLFQQRSIDYCLPSLLFISRYKLRTDKLERKGQRGTQHQQRGCSRDVAEFRWTQHAGGRNVVCKIEAAYRGRTEEHYQAAAEEQREGPTPAALFPQFARAAQKRQPQGLGLG